jgi:hypothetical protein
MKGEKIGGERLISSYIARPARRGRVTSQTFHHIPIKTKQNCPRHSGPGRPAHAILIVGMQDTTDPPSLTTVEQCVVNAQAAARAEFVPAVFILRRPRRRSRPAPTQPDATKCNKTPRIAMTLLHRPPQATISRPTIRSRDRTKKSRAHLIHCKQTA